MEAPEPVYTWPVPGILLAAARDPDPAAAILALLADLPGPLVVDVIRGLAQLAVAGWTKAGRLAGLDDDAILTELGSIALDLAAEQPDRTMAARNGACASQAFRPSRRRDDARNAQRDFRGPGSRSSSLPTSRRPS